MASAKEIEEVIGISGNTIETWSRSVDSKALLSKFLKSFSKHDLQERVKSILEQGDIEKVTWKKLIEDIVAKSITLFPSGSYKLIYSSQIDKISPNKRGPDLLMYDRKAGSAIIIFITSLIPSRGNMTRIIQRDTAFSLEVLQELSQIYSNEINSIEYLIISKSNIPERIYYKIVNKHPVHFKSIMYKDSNISTEELEKALSILEIKGMKINELGSQLYNNENIIIV